MSLTNHVTSLCALLSQFPASRQRASQLRAMLPAPQTSRDDVTDPPGSDPQDVVVPTHGACAHLLLLAH